MSIKLHFSMSTKFRGFYYLVKKLVKVRYFHLLEVSASTRWKYCHQTEGFHLVAVDFN